MTQPRALVLVAVLAFAGQCLAEAGSSAPSRSAELNTGEVVDIPYRMHDDAGIRVDGRLDDAAWAEAVVIGDFIVIDPDTMEKPRWETRLMLLYTERGIYAGYDLEQPRDMIVSVLSPRDTGTNFGDFVGLVLDTSGDGKYGYWMSLAASGVKTDGTLIPEAQFNRDWDGVWYGETAPTEKGWSAEFFVPWSQLAMPKESGTRRMSLFASRRSVAIGERWGVPALPFTITKWIQYMRPLEMEGVDPRQQWSVIPYTSVTQDQVEKETDFRAGAEVFWRPSSNFQVSGSILPDFGNVESDAVIVNLSALETFFPEKRLFFLEGRDVFLTSPRADASKNFFPVTVVNTRRIGGSPRAPAVLDGVEIPAAQLDQPVELYGAVKATGQLGSLRYGLLGAMEDDVTFKVDDLRFEQSGSDYGVARLLWEDVSYGSYRALGTISTLTAHPEEDAVVHGIDYHYMTANGSWKIDGQVLYSDKDSVGGGWGTFADAVYTPRRGLKINLEFEHYDDKLDINDLGFLQRNDITRGGIGVNYTNPNVGWARQLNLSGRSIYEVNGDGDVTRQGASVSTNVLLNSLGRVRASALFFGRRTDDLNSFGNGSFVIPSRWEGNVDYFSDPSRPFSYRIGFDLDEEKVHGIAIKARLGATWRPSQRMKVDVFAEYVRRDGWLLHQDAPEDFDGQNNYFTTFDTREWRPTMGIDFFFTAKQQIRLSAQWVGIQAREQRFFQIPENEGELDEVDKPWEQSDDFTISSLNVQLRYRWELAPLSDLFIVYTLNGDQAPPRASFTDLLESSFSDPVFEKIVLKLRYRLGS